MQTINGITFKNALLSAANHLSNHRKEVNRLHIFPVPDGDTGTNLALTAQGAAAALQSAQPKSAGEAAAIAASAMMRSAKGNAGVMLSLLFQGIAKNAEGKETLNGADLVQGLGMGVEMACAAADNPAEGTILTVARAAYKSGRDVLAHSDSVLPVWKAVCKGAKKILELTPELSPILKKAGIVDAGGRGLCLLFAGMYTVFAENKVIQLLEEDEGQPTVAVHLGDSAFRTAAAAFDHDATRAYCTECIIDRTGKEDQNPEILRRYLLTIGDCVLVADDPSVIKVHVHTDAPGKVLQKALDFGTLRHVKVDNMGQQTGAGSAVPAKPTEDYGFVAVAAGDGVQSLFRDLGCKQIIGGGQTMNPSTEDIYRAILATPAKTVYILPNNKNILLAAEQAAALVTDRETIVVPTRTISQGMSALIAFSSTRTPADNKAVMAEAAHHVKTGQVTFADRDSRFGGVKIKAGDTLGLIDGKLTLVEKEGDPVAAVVRLVRSMITRDTKFITLLYGMEITEEQAAQACEKIKAKAGRQAEVHLVDGGQPIYHFLASVE